MSKDQKEICLYCKWWCMTIDPGHENMTMGRGECRLHGPVLNSVEGKWPTTVGDDWCGSFKGRPDDHDSWQSIGDLATGVMDKLGNSGSDEAA